MEINITLELFFHAHIRASGWTMRKLVSEKREVKRSLPCWEETVRFLHKKANIFRPTRGMQKKTVRHGTFPGWSFRRLTGAKSIKNSTRRCDVKMTKK